MANKVIVVVGPTATGKTAVSVELAKRLDGEVISADSMQIYKELRIGTARPDGEEMCGIPHHMMGVVSPDESYSVAQYKYDATEHIESILSRGKLPIVVGGTGLYIGALTCDLDFTGVQADEEYRQELSKLYDEKGGEYVHRILAAQDPEAALRIHMNDKKRLIRRLEINRLGITDKFSMVTYSTKYDFCMIGITKDRPVLYSDIETRVDKMFNMGLEEEVSAIYEKYGKISAFSAIGYKEFLPYFNGEQSIDDVRADIKQSTRRFAKRQLTWFRRDERIQWYNVCKHDCILSLVNDIISSVQAEDI